MNDEITPAPGKCRATKRGRVDLTCSLERDHDRGDSPTWHEATFADHQEITYPGSRHVIHLTEHVTWEPVDVAGEVARLLTRDRARES